MEKNPLYTPEVPDMPEELPFSSKIRLAIFRHAEKVGADKVDHIDKKIALTPHGKKQSIEKGRDLVMNAGMAVASSRDRTQETALYAMSGDEPGVPDAQSFDKLKETIDEDLEYGSRMLIDSRLDMPFTKGGAEHLELQEMYAQGGYFKALVTKHEKLMAEKGEDCGESTYAIQARNIASLIKKYITAAPRWDELVHKDLKYKDTLERILSTHGGISESFLSEIIDRTKSREERDEFVELFPNGFDFVQGFEAEIMTMLNGELVLRLTANVPLKDREPFVLNEIIPLEVIDAIIADYSPVKK